MTLAATLEQEHHQIDAGIEAFRETGDTVRLGDAVEALRRHIYLEEVLVFPSLREAGMMAPVFVMLREHGEMWRLLDRMGADEDATELRSLCDELMPLLAAHNGKEEPILYPQVDAVLDDALAATLREFLESGSTPEGWVCEQAAGGPRKLPFG
ncbi:MAG TPA: hemerythrin domain-containing protein [Marmoricola sp.]|nr:hemerythrin domain-containing protein [Marmoricola sp.]